MPKVEGGPIEVARARIDVISDDELSLVLATLQLLYQPLKLFVGLIVLV